MPSIIGDLRVRLDQMTEKIVSGLKDRSRYKQNLGVFSEKFYDGMSWFGYRLKKEQDLDSEFGRYIFPDQYPVIFTEEQLTQPIIKREIPQSDIKIVNIDIGEKIIEMYKDIIPKICKKGENPFNYGETVKCDVNNIILYNERINGIGRFVAQSKLKKYPEITQSDSDDEIKKFLIFPEREKQVIEDALNIAEKYELPHPKCITKFFRKIIDLTIDIQIQYIRKIKALS